MKRAAGIDALKIVQKHRGWISDDVLSQVADVLEMSATDLDAVATFYNFILRKPVGRHVILVCDSVSCWIMGYDTIVNYLKNRLGIGLGETTGDGRFTLLPNVCLGACDRAPVMMVDDQLYGDLDAEKIDKILASYD
jgi:NADH-quinone oxidoreductase subunit E